MISADYLLLLLGMGLVTYIPRWFPLFFLSQRKLPKWLIEWLDFIPVAILSALVLPELLKSGAERHLDFSQPKLWVAIPTLIVALWTKSLGGTVLFGMLLFWAAGKF
jgi:branched-subunit amino acid transport protein